MDFVTEENQPVFSAPGRGIRRRSGDIGETTPTVTRARVMRTHRRCGTGIELPQVKRWMDLQVPRAALSHTVISGRRTAALRSTAACHEGTHETKIMGPRWADLPGICPGDPTPRSGRHVSDQHKRPYEALSISAWHPEVLTLDQRVGGSSPARRTSDLGVPSARGSPNVVRGSPASASCLRPIAPTSRRRAADSSGPRDKVRGKKQRGYQADDPCDGQGGHREAVRPIDELGDEDRAGDRRAER
jgi:hypothetical protein